MVIKYIETIEFPDDHYVFDESLNWGLLIYHDSTLYFGKDRIFDPETEYQNTILLNKLRGNLNDKNERE